ncbi:response regulator transcription factor [Aquimarina sp. 2201CG5-10]|uniref:LytR/AlgR family response regulator transcription factor n=1 Tax=Aquimarina callyspongiae TaxID=3098150 RepID=UPI002AB5420C|nr:response regulator transcription factor [Aquimarina sp. 2201CG5-10]MDY8137202.1 response regulator transcription factor [Aquimarina sp. 2201CG5-10]
MNSIRCLIVDDEPPAIRLLENYIKKVPFLTIVKATTSPLEALAILNKETVDLVFLDIQMPELTGLQISKIIKGQTKVIFTTAYPQFALESYELQAVDYLLKPFEFERFYEAILKIKKEENSEKKESPTEAYFFVKTDGKNNFEKVYVNEVCYIEGLKNYVAIHLKDQQIITYNTLKNIEAYLSNTDFVKIHKSYIVSLRQIDKTDSLSVYINGNVIPIGDTYRQGFFEKINQKKI